MTDLRRRSLLAGLIVSPLVLGAAKAATSGRSLARSRVANFARGYNLPGVTDVPEAEARMPDSGLISDLVQRGLMAIRLPVEPKLLLESSEHLAHVIATTALLLGAGASVTIDMHPGVETDDILRADPAAGADLIEAAWRLLAPRTVSLPADRVTLELLNEPALSTANWRALRVRLVDVIRNSTADHTLIWGAAEYQAIYETVDDPGIEDENAIAAVHFYDPMIFTHQGQSWGDSELAAIRGLPFPFAATDDTVKAMRASLKRDGAKASVATLDMETKSPWTKKRIDKEFARLNDWATANDWPVIVNEFGVFNDHAPVASRAEWLRVVRGAAEANGFGWAHWEFDGGFGFTSSRTDVAGLDDEILSALVGSA